MTRYVPSSRSGSALVAVLWCAVLMTTIVVTVFGVTRLDLRIAKNHGDHVQARFTALGGIEYAKAQLYDAFRRAEGDGRAFDTAIYDDPGRFKDVELGRGHFSIVHRPVGDTRAREPMQYGVLDEERFLNLNYASIDEIKKLPGLDDGAAAAIVDWRDSDDKVSNGGAEAADYERARSPVTVRNAPFESLREVLMVNGVDGDRALGEDANGDGLLNENENDGEQSMPRDNADGVLEAGWLQHVCLESAVLNRDAMGRDRVPVAQAVAEDFEALPGIDRELAEQIVLYRDVKSIDTLVALLEVEELVEENKPEALQPAGKDRPGSGIRPTSGEISSDGDNSNGYKSTGNKLIDESLFADIVDGLTADAALVRPGVVNINTCSREVLACLPGMTDELAAAVIEHRYSIGQFGSIGQLLEVDGVTREILGKLVPRIDIRSNTFRIVSEATIPTTGARQRIAVTVRFGEWGVETLSYREDL